MHVEKLIGHAYLGKWGLLRIYEEELKGILVYM
jgi:hypothetical protein